jgi:hypothetical protein
LSPSETTTQSAATGDFPERYEKPEIGGLRGVHFVSAEASLDLEGCFGSFVSACEIPFPGKRRPEVETGSNAALQGL